MHIMLTQENDQEFINSTMEIQKRVEQITILQSNLCITVDNQADIKSSENNNISTSMRTITYLPR